jgi:nitrite reductase/ring-hydroxylating ferredoxin subunit
MAEAAPAEGGIPTTDAMAFFRLEKITNLHDGYRRVFHAGRLSLLLIQQDGRRFLLRNRCPHKDFPLHDGTLQGTRLRCRHHGMDFDLAQGGRCVQFPRQCAEMFPLAYDGLDVGVDLPEAELGWL